MRVLFVRRLVIFLAGLAFLVGSGAQATPSAELMARAAAGAGQIVIGVHCATVAVSGVAGPTSIEQAPCKCSPDCDKVFGCIFAPVLPGPSITFGGPFARKLLAIWPPLATPPGLSAKPGLFPPIAA